MTDSNPTPSSGQSAYTAPRIGLPPTATVGAKVQAMKDAHAERTTTGGQPRRVDVIRERHAERTSGPPRHPATKQFVKRRAGQ
jgi:hypothetical protein